jgi:IclR family transcriptional regulator, acetate operon repressor
MATETMSSSLQRGLAVLDLLSTHPAGVSVGAVATALDLPPSGTHRLLNQLIEYGYVHQDGNKGEYVLGMKLPALGLSYLAQSGITDVAQPVLDRLAEESLQLVRLSVVDGDTLVWVAFAQGARGGLRYDPGSEQGVTAHLASSASGLAWLSSMSDEDALMKAARQGFCQPSSGPGAPASAADFLTMLRLARERGYAEAVDAYIPGMASMAAPIRMSDGRVVGALSIAGPSSRLSTDRMAELAPALVSATDEMAQAARGSVHFRTCLSPKSAPSR